MLQLPDSGFQRSIKVHNVKLGVLCDWIEASVIFLDDMLSKTEVIDSLCENGIYEKQDFAAEMVDSAWEELRKRENSLGQGASFEIKGSVIERKIEWQKNPAYSFCVLLTIQVLCKSWAKEFGDDFTDQGYLFELVTKECLDQLGWDVLHTGCSPKKSSTINKVIDDVCEHIAEPEKPGQADMWFSKSGKEEQLDIVCRDPSFFDNKGGRVLVFFQCASGGDWEEKVKTPDPADWEKVIAFTSIPHRGFAMPFTLLMGDFQRYAGKVNGVFMDRYRLQTPAYDGETGWVSRDLSKQIIAWMKPRVCKLPDENS